MAVNVERRPFLTKPKAAEVLGVSARTLDRLRDRGALPAVQYLPRGRVRFRAADVERLLDPEPRPRPARRDELEWK
jgi:excisionase family DNA binding protein